MATSGDPFHIIDPVMRVLLADGLLYSGRELVLRDILFVDDEFTGAFEEGFMIGSFDIEVCFIPVALLFPFHSGRLGKVAIEAFDNGSRHFGSGYFLAKGEEGKQQGSGEQHCGFHNDGFIQYNLRL
jgi:hypothetical protein